LNLIEYLSYIGTQNFPVLVEFDARKRGKLPRLPQSVTFQMYLINLCGPPQGIYI